MYDNQLNELDIAMRKELAIAEDAIYKKHAFIQLEVYKAFIKQFNTKNHIIIYDSGMGCTSFKIINKRTNKEFMCYRKPYRLIYGIMLRFEEKHFKWDTGMYLNDSILN
jgi:hypothetical protein